MTVLLLGVAAVRVFIGAGFPSLLLYLAIGLVIGKAGLRAASHLPLKARTRATLEDRVQLRQEMGDSTHSVETPGPVDCWTWDQDGLGLRMDAPLALIAAVGLDKVERKPHS